MSTRIPISTGCLPPADTVSEIIRDVHARFAATGGGKVADYIPALASASPELFGVALAGVGGQVWEAGDTRHRFSIQSVSKPFVFALICEAIGEQEAKEKLGANSTGLPFNSVIAIERAADGMTNPMVNAGAIAATSLAPGATAGEKWSFLKAGLSRFAGRELEVDGEVYACESENNQRNRSIANLLDSYRSIYWDPARATDLYTRQCSLAVDTRDLAVMAATLANGGVNPVTLERVIAEVHCRHVLTVMVTAGMYENSGDWLYDTGLPGKSGVSGGMIAAAPGKCGMASFSPPLDEAGNSVRGGMAMRALSEDLGLNLFASAPFQGVDS